MLRRSFLVPCALVAVGTGALVALRPRGDDAEPLPGDDLIPGAPIVETHETVIPAPPGSIWPWLIQIGYGRGGFYSYDALERLGGIDITNAERIEPEWQDLHVDDLVNLAPTVALRAAVVDAERALVLSSDGGYADDVAGLDFDFSWAFVLDDLGGGRTRLVMRERYMPHSASSAISIWAARPVARLMSRGMMRGLAARSRIWVGSGLD